MFDLDLEFRFLTSFFRSDFGSGETQYLESSLKRLQSRKKKHDATCHVTSRDVTSRHVASCHVMRHHVVSCRVTSNHIVSSCVMLCHVISHCITLYHIVSHCVTTCQFVSHRHTLWHQVMSVISLTSNDASYTRMIILRMQKVSFS
jgi:hypothetical protein